MGINRLRVRKEQSSRGFHSPAALWRACIGSVQRLERIEEKPQGGTDRHNRLDPGIGRDALLIPESQLHCNNQLMLRSRSLEVIATTARFRSVDSQPLQLKGRRGTPRVADDRNRVGVEITNSDKS